jgi:antitoxin component YwqK of YwqJK toxin-antitoxin module
LKLCKIGKRGKATNILIGAIILLALLSIGAFGYFYEREVRVVQSEYDGGGIEEVWIYRESLFGKKEKIKEVTYFENGHKYTEVDYKNGKVNGWARMWYENGNLHLEATYKDNKTHGVRNAYHENGRVFCRAEYENGKLLRKQNWDENGNEIYVPIERE